MSLTTATSVYRTESCKGCCLVYNERTCRELLARGDVSAIAAQLRDDQSRARQGYLPSPLARYMPAYGSRLSQSVAVHLSGEAAPEHAAASKIPRSLQRLRYEGIISSLRIHLRTMDVPNRSDSDVHEDVASLPKQVPVADMKTALRVLDFFRSSAVSEPLTNESTIGQLERALKLYCGSEVSASKSHSGKSRHLCYICRYVIHRPHPEYQRLCWQCGDFNIAESKLSLPEHLQLRDRCALVTGGRVKLGYHTALRLLRCGANVLVSSRYPHDAAQRYGSEEDADVWRPRLKIVGADFRTASDVFRLVAIARSWVEECSPSGGLDILINNAAQTLTDSVAEEIKALRLEGELKHEKDHHSLLLHGGTAYVGRVRGGQMSTWTNRVGIGSKPHTSTSGDIEDPQDDATLHVASLGHTNTSTQLSQVPIKSSWTQSITEIPYEDVVTAYSVNALSVHILICELLPLMSTVQEKKNKTQDEDSETYKSDSSVRPSGYIVNVSSREGIFESSPASGHKSGKHVHTNTSKAALNMITETEAWPCWRDRRIAMNTVDPGYMSAAPEYESNGPCPIGFEDGAARVLWPIARGEHSQAAVWGRFLKHYGKVDVQTGAGRG